MFCPIYFKLISQLAFAQVSVEGRVGKIQRIGEKDQGKIRVEYDDGGKAWIKSSCGRIEILSLATTSANTRMAADIEVFPRHKLVAVPTLVVFA